VKAELAKVGVEPAQVDAVLEADRVRREAIQAVEALRAERTKASNAISAT
jgi:seryl-tRNA synthetase